MNALDILCLQLTRDLFAIAKFLLILNTHPILRHLAHLLGVSISSSC